LLPTFPLVTRQLLFAQNPVGSPTATSPQVAPTAPSAASEEEITIRATEQEKVGPIFKLRGHAEIHYETYVLYADEISYNSQSGDATAEGHVVLDGGPNDEHIEASRGRYNIHSQTGHFESVVGSIGLRFRGTRSILTSSNPFAFTGNIVGQSAYWDINRSMDATLGAEYYSIRGWGQRGELRVRPSETSFLDLNYLGVLDRGIGFPPVKQGGENARLNAEGLFGHFRGVANLDYLSSFVFRLAFNEIYSQAVNSEVKSEAFLSNTSHGFSYNASSER